MDSVLSSYQAWCRHRGFGRNHEESFEIRGDSCRRNYDRWRISVYGFLLVGLRPFASSISSVVTFLALALAAYGRLYGSSG